MGYAIRLKRKEVAELLVQNKRICGICGVIKDVSMFWKREFPKSGFLPGCRECNRRRSQMQMSTPEGKAAKRLRYLKGKEKGKDKRVNRGYLKLYGIEYVQKIRLWEDCGKKCMICSKELFDIKQSCIDHDHVTHDIRGILCKKCNLGLGQFSDNVELLRKAVAYLVAIPLILHADKSKQKILATQKHNG